jgi:hypothetical protein
MVQTSISPKGLRSWCRTNGEILGGRRVVEIAVASEAAGAAVIAGAMGTEEGVDAGARGCCHRSACDRRRCTWQLRMGTWSACKSCSTTAQMLHSAMLLPGHELALWHARRRVGRQRPGAGLPSHQRSRCMAACLGRSWRYGGEAGWCWRAGVGFRSRRGGELRGVGVGVCAGARHCLFRAGRRRRRRSTAEMARVWG